MKSGKDRKGGKEEGRSKRGEVGGESEHGSGEALTLPEADGGESGLPTSVLLVAQCGAHTVRAHYARAR